MLLNLLCVMIQLFLTDDSKNTAPPLKVRLCFALLLLHKEQDGIHMPRRLMDNLEGEVIDEKFHEGTLWHDILSVYPDGEDALLLNICEYCAFWRTP